MKTNLQFVRTLACAALVAHVLGCAPGMYISNSEAPRLSAEAAAGAAGAVLLRSDMNLAFAMHEASLVAVLTERHRVQLTAGPGASFARSLTEAARGAERTEVAVRVTHADATQVEARALAKAPFDFPGATAGDVIDIYIRQTFAVPQALPIWSLARPVPIKDLRWQISTASEIQLRLAAGNGPERRDADIVHPDERTWNLRLNDVPAVVSAPLQPGATRRGPWLVVVPVAAPNGSGVGSTWEQVADWTRQHLTSTAGIDDATRREMRAAIDGGYIKPLLDRVHPHPDDAPFHVPPRSFVDMGNVGASSAEAAAVAAALHEKAQWVLVAPAEQVAPLVDLPGLYPFSQAAVIMPNGTWADPLCEVCNANQVGFDVAGGRAMTVTQPVKWLDVPLHLSQRDSRRYTVDWELSVRGDLTGTVLAELHGQAALKAHGLLGDTEDAAARAASARRALFEDVGPQVESLNDEGTAGGNNQYTLQASLSSHLSTQGGAVTVRPLDLAGDAFPWELPAGNHELLLEAPQAFETSCSVAMPLPMARNNRFKPVTIKSPFGSYESRFETRSNFLLYVRRLDLQVRLITPDKRGELAAFISKIREAERKPTVVHLED